MSHRGKEVDAARVLIAEDAELVRCGICEVLTADGRFSVVGEISRPEAVAEACRELDPDIVLIGSGEHGDGGNARWERLSALRQTCRDNPSARVVVLLNDDAAEDLIEVLRAGARGAVLRGAPANELLATVEDVMDGETGLDRRLARSLFDYVANNSHLSPSAGSPIGPRLDPAAIADLSPREQQVLKSLAQGHRNKEIAAELGVTTGTVKTHLRHIFRKLRVDDRVGAVLVALRVSPREAA